MAMLVSVFDKDEPAGSGDNGGTAKDIDVVGFKCAGKTGTAHKYDPETKQYSNRYLSSFAGLAPADHPQLAIVVMVDEPSGGDYYGSKVAAPVFAALASEALRYLGVPGEPARATATREADSSANARRAGKKKEDRRESSGAGVHSPATDAPGETWSDPPAVTIPDFAGLGMQRALEIAATLHLQVSVIGSGRVSTQKPLPGSLTNTGELTLWFSDDTGKALLRRNEPGWIDRDND